MPFIHMMTNVSVSETAEKAMKEAFGKEALREEISCRMNDLVRLEKNPFLRAVIIRRLLRSNAS